MALLSKYAVNFQDKCSKAYGYCSELLSEFLIDLTERLKIVLERSKDLSKANYEVGLIHLYNGDLYDAQLRFKTSLYFRPSNVMSLYNLIRVYYLRGKLEQAFNACNQALDSNPDNEEIIFIAKLLTNQVPDHVPINIVKDHYDSVAVQYNNKMSSINYLVPDLFAQNFMKLLETYSHKYITILDVGCGTGLCGRALYERKDNLNITGIDIAKNMLAMASKETISNDHIYKTLLDISLDEYVNNTVGSFDFVIAGHSIIYDLDIKSNIEKLAELTRKGGYIIISLPYTGKETSEMNVDCDYYKYTDKDIELLKHIKHCKIVSCMQHHISSKETGYILVLNKLV